GGGGWNNQLSSKKFILNINSYLEEGWPGRIHFVNFSKNYEKKYKEKNYLLFQIHPTSPWDEISWNDFDKTISFLLSHNSVFMTPYEYFFYKNNLPGKTFSYIKEKLYFSNGSYMAIAN
ncbi:MAG: hypothetical protein D3904_03280, partial [Candidatus Electrothrix sp. EH2]|nr:hypothetical protein [Candidatus Electrothrix sp. EH2]